MSRTLLTMAACLLAACGTTLAASAPTGTPKPSATATALATCLTYPPLSLDVGAEIAHMKTAATVIEVTSACSVRVRVSGGNVGTLASFNGRTIELRAMARTTYNTAPQGDLTAIGRFGLKPGDVFTLSFDSREFPDGSHPLNYMNW